MFSSRHQNWDTPQDFFDKMNKRFNFTTDVCATPESAKCANYFSPEVDGLSQKWEGSCWCNPPYGREYQKWVKKAWQSGYGGERIVMLLPARTDTIVFHRYIYKQPNVEIEFLKGRLTFGSDAYWQWLWSQELIDGKKNTLFGTRKKNAAPFPSMIVIFNP